MYTGNPTGVNGLIRLRPNVTVASLTIPSDVPASQYINNVMRTGIAMCLTEYGEVIKNVEISNELLPYLEFPNKIGEKGTPLFCITIPEYQVIVAVGIGNNRQKSNGAPDGFYFAQGNAAQLASVHVSKNQPCVNVQAASTTDAHAEINITADGDNSSVYVSSDASIEMDSAKMVFNSGDTIELSAYDYNAAAGTYDLKSQLALDSLGDATLSGESVTLDSKSISLGSNASQPAVLGDTLVSFMQQFIEQIMALKIVVNGPAGVVDPSSIVQLLRLTQSAQSVLSKQVKTS